MQVFHASILNTCIYMFIEYEHNDLKKIKLCMYQHPPFLYFRLTLHYFLALHENSYFLLF